MSHSAVWCWPGLSLTQTGPRLWLRLWWWPRQERRRQLTGNILTLVNTSNLGATLRCEKIQTTQIFFLFLGLISVKSRLDGAGLKHCWTSKIENYPFCCVVIVSPGTACLSLMRGLMRLHDSLQLDTGSCRRDNGKTESQKQNVFIKGTMRRTLSQMLSMRYNVTRDELMN